MFFWPYLQWWSNNAIEIGIEIRGIRPDRLRPIRLHRKLFSIGPNRLRVPGRIVYIENLLQEEAGSSTSGLCYVNILLITLYIGINATIANGTKWVAVQVECWTVLLFMKPVQSTVISGRNGDEDTRGMKRLLNNWDAMSKCPFTGGYTEMRWQFSTVDAAINIQTDDHFLSVTASWHASWIEMLTHSRPSCWAS